MWQTVRRWLRDPKRLGLRGEYHVEQYLKHHGYRTLQRRFSCRSGEIDLIMTDPDGGIVFIEVKTRRSTAFQPIENVITNTKKVRLVKTARHYLATHHIQDQPLRFDVVTVLHTTSHKKTLTHYQNVFVP